MRAGLPQLDRLLVQLAGAAVGARQQAVPHGLHALLAVRVEEDDDGVPLGVVEGVHRFGRHVQQSVAILRDGRGKGLDEVIDFSLTTEAAALSLAGRTCSMICRMVLSRTTPDDFSLPASFGSVSERGDRGED